MKVQQMTANLECQKTSTLCRIIQKLGFLKKKNYLENLPLFLSCCAYKRFAAQQLSHIFDWIFTYSIAEKICVCCWNIILVRHIYFLLSALICVLRSDMHIASEVSPLWKWVGVVWRGWNTYSSSFNSCLGVLSFYQNLANSENWQVVGTELTKFGSVTV